MAYGNWGAFVFKNGERQHDREDQTPYEETRVAGYHQAFGIDRGKLGCHHAVLGDGDVRLCGYKSYPVLFLRGEQVDLKPFLLPAGADSWFDDNIDQLQGSLEGYDFTAHPSDEGNRVDLSLKCPDGTLWTAECGYMMGAGHDD